MGPWEHWELNTQKDFSRFNLSVVLMVDLESHMANWIDRHSIIKMVKPSKLPMTKEM